MSNSLRSIGLCDPLPARFLCSWNSPGKNTGVGCHFLLQGIFSIQELNPRLPHCRHILHCLSHQGSPTIKRMQWLKFVIYPKELQELAVRNSHTAHARCLSHLCIWRILELGEYNIWEKWGICPCCDDVAFLKPLLFSLAWAPCLQMTMRLRILHSEVVTVIPWFTWLIEFSLLALQNWVSLWIPSSEQTRQKIQKCFKKGIYLS